MVAKICQSQIGTTDPTQKGKQVSHNPIATLILNRCRSLLRGDLDTLCQEFLADLGKRKVKQKSVSGEKLKENNARRARILASEGDLSRACSALTSLGMAEDSAAVLSKLQEKHPAGTQPPASTFGPAVQFSKEKVLKAALSISRASGAGPSGERASHLHAAFQGPSSASADRALCTTTQVVNTLLLGRAPAEISKWVVGANLFALKKKDDSIRPVAAGNVTRRLMSELCCPKIKELLS